MPSNWICFACLFTFFHSQLQSRFLLCQYHQDHNQLILADNLICTATLLHDFTFTECDTMHAPIWIIMTCSYNRTEEVSDITIPRKIKNLKIFSTGPLFQNICSKWNSPEPKLSPEQNFRDRSTKIGISDHLWLGVRPICQPHNFGNNRMPKEPRIMLE